jgi:hypothetical protein
MPGSRFATSATDHGWLIRFLRSCSNPLSLLQRLTFGKDPKVSKRSLLLHTALHFAALRSGYLPYASLRGVRSLRPSLA